MRNPLLDYVDNGDNGSADEFVDLSSGAVPAIEWTIVVALAE